MNKPVYLILLVVTSLTIVSAYGVNKQIIFSNFLNIWLKYGNNFFLQDFEGIPDYDHIKEQFLNLQAAQRNVLKKAESVQPPTRLSETQIQKAISDLKQGMKNGNFRTSGKSIAKISKR